MSGANIDSSGPDRGDSGRGSDAIARLKLTQALQRATYAIAWERAWPHLARFLTVVGLFLTASWAGLWLVLPFVARVAVTCLFAIGALASLWPMLRFRWPAREMRDLAGDGRPFGAPFEEADGIGHHRLDEQLFRRGQLDRWWSRLCCRNANGPRGARRGRRTRRRRLRCRRSRCCCFRRSASR